MKFIVNLFFMVFVVALSHGQNNDPDYTLRLTDIMFNTFSTVPELGVTPQNSQNNEVFIQQIGNANRINTQISAEKRSANYIQEGNYNNISILATANTFEQSILQHGDANHVFDFSHGPTQDMSLNLTQQGNALHFEKFGSNSISENIQFNMTGNSRTVIMRNFK